MGSFFYSVFLLVYRTGILVSSLFSSKARLFRQGRKGWRVHLKVINPENKPLLWLHCASLGEFEQGRPLLEAFKKEFPGYATLLTFFSPSGYEVHRNSAIADNICYLPLDGPAAARYWTAELRPAVAIFVKYEFWFYYSRELARQNIPLLSVSSIFRKNQPFFKFWGGFNRRILSYFTHFFVQDRESEQLLASIGLANVTVSGDSRFDRVLDLSRKVGVNGAVERFCGNSEVFIIGSAWPADMEVLYAFINQHKEFKFIIAPHEISDSFISAITKNCTRPTVRFSELTASSDADILIIDNIGMLSSLYRHASFAWVGGAYGKGLHNILEAAVYGIPVLFGNKNYRKFREATMLCEQGGAFAIGTADELREVFDQISLPDKYQEIKAVNERVVSENIGATEKIMAYCRELLAHERIST